jgi:hypothetical protein
MTRVCLLLLLAILLALLLAQAQPPDTLIDEVSRSGQIVEIAAPPSSRLSTPLIAPGAPPLLGFRMMEGKLRHRFGDLDLVMDDAGH